MEFSLFFEKERRESKVEKEKRFLFLSSVPQSQMPLPSRSTLQRLPSMLLMPLAVAAARRVAGSRATTTTCLYSMRRHSSPLLLSPRPTAAAAAIRRSFVASASTMGSPPRHDKRLTNRHLNQGRPGTPFKAAGGAVAAAATALPSHCSGCGISLQGSDPNLPG